MRVYGIPAPQGSKRFVGTSKAGHGILIESSKKLKPWRQAVWAEALGAKAKLPAFQTLTGAVEIDVTFFLARPQRPKNKIFPICPPDCDKLQRSTFDALTTAGIYTDDSQIVDIRARKRFARAPEEAGAIITVKECANT